MHEAAILNEQRRQAAELAELRYTCEDLARQLLKAQDRRIGAALLPLAHELLGDRTFTQSSLIAAAFEARTAIGAAVLELARDVGAGGDVPKSFGRLLGRLEGAVLNGYRLAPSGESRGSLAWQVVRVSGEENPQE